jgi:hypothetical protein
MSRVDDDQDRHVSFYPTRSGRVGPTKAIRVLEVHDDHDVRLGFVVITDTLLTSSLSVFSEAEAS